MGEIQLINSVLEWERRLEIEEEKRKNHRTEPYVNYLEAPQSCRKERKAVFVRIFQHRQRQADPDPVDFVEALTNVSTVQTG